MSLILKRSTNTNVIVIAYKLHSLLRGRPFGVDDANFDARCRWYYCPWSLFICLQSFINLNSIELYFQLRRPSSPFPFPRLPDIPGKSTEINKCFMNSCVESFFLLFFILFLLHPEAHRIKNAVFCACTKNIFQIALTTKRLYTRNRPHLCK